MAGEETDRGSIKVSGHNKIKIEGSNQFIGVQKNYFDKTDEKAPSYRVENIHNTPLSGKLVTAIGVISGIMTIISFIVGAIKPIIGFFKGSFDTSSYNELWIFLFLISFLVLILAIILGKDAKARVMRPIVFNKAANWYDGDLKIAKIVADPCPKCEGKLKFTNKTVEWDSNGKPIKKITVLQCNRNPEHYWKVDITDNRPSNEME